MITVAIIENDLEETEQDKAMLRLYEQDYGVEFSVSVFTDTVEFLAGYSPRFDILLMDIDMPYVNGMDAAKRIRVQDKTTVIIFITHMPQYAIKGYSVDALDYIMKPVTYFALSTVLSKAIMRIRRDEDKPIIVKTGEAVYKLYLSQILYIEVIGHKCIYQAKYSNIEVYTTIKSIEETLPDKIFVRCSNAYIVNLRHVDFVDKSGVHIGDAVLTLSRAKRKEFVEKLAEYCGS